MMRDSLTFLAVVVIACVAALPCPDALYELQHRSWLQPYVQATNPAVSAQFGIAPNAGVISIAQWVALTPQQGKAAQSTMFSVVNGVPGYAPYGDSYRLFWDDKNSRMTFELINNATSNLPQDGSNSTDALQAYSVITTLYGSGVIEVNSNQYRLVSLTLNAVTGTVSIAVDGVFLIKESVPALQQYGVSLGENSTITLNADIEGSNILIGQTADVIVAAGKVFSASDLQYLSQFRYPLNASADGNCSAVPTSPAVDPSCPQGNIAVYYFTEGGWSFPGSRVIDNWGGFASWNVGASELSLTTRSVTSGLGSLISPSWTPAQLGQSSCGAEQSATIPFASGPVQRVTLVFQWTGAGPNDNDQFTIKDNDAGVTITMFNGQLISATKSFSFTYQVSGGKLNFTITSGSFSTYCLENVIALSVGPVIADPASTYSGVSTAISFYAGVEASDSVAFIPFGQPCSSVAAKDLMTLFVATPVADRNYTTFLQVVLPTEIASGAYSMCIFPNGIVGSEAYISSFCSSTDYSSTYLCQLDVAYLPSGAIPLPRDWVHNLLHLGADYFDSLPHGLFNVDYFATIGGQASMQPQIGDMFNTTLGVYVWTPLQSPEGLFGQPNLASPLAYESVQYFSMALYSGVAQTIALSVKFANGVMIFIDGENVFQEYLSSEDVPASDITIYHSDPIVLEEGWHQVNVKLWAPPASTTSVFALRFDQAQQLSWAFEMPGGSGANGNFTEICANADSSVPCVASNPDLNHDECVALGCCYFNTTTAGYPHCTAPGGGLVPYRTDARCGVGFPAANLNVSQCNPRSSTHSTCCSAWNWCGSGPMYCDCPTCTDYTYLNQPRCSYALWGTKARCLGTTFVDAGFVSYATCAQSCDADPTCTAFSLTGANYGSCRLYSDCGQTVVSASAAVTYKKFCGTTATPCSLVPQSGMRCGDNVYTMSNAGVTSMSDCMALCMVATRCTGVQYNSNTSMCYFLSRNCSSPLVPSAGSSIAYFHCPGDTAAPPAPLPHPPNTTTFTAVGCFSDPTATLLSNPNAPWQGNGQLYYSGNYNNFSATVMTVEYCRTYCESLGARYFAISKGTICTCGVRYDAVATAESDCSTPCPANASEMCGGPAAASLFMIQLAQGPCIDGYWFFNGNCFKYVSDSAMSSWLPWASARAACAAEGGALASIHSSAESQFLLSFPFSTNPTLSRITWAGATLSSWGFGYEWVDGSDFDFSDWRLGEPNSGGGTGINEGCLSVFSNHATPYKGSWNDADCTSSYPYLCKINLNHSLSYPRLYLAQSESLNLCVSSFYIPQLTQDLTAFFAFDYSLSDRSGNYNALAVMTSDGLSSSQANFTTGIRRYALSLSGSSYLLAKTNWDVTKDFLTVAVWVRQTVAPTSGQIIISKSYQDDAANVSMPQFTWAISYDSTGSNLCFYVGYTHVCTPAPSLAGWFHVAGSYDGIALSLYINGTVMKWTTVPSSGNSSYAPLLRSTHPVAVGYRSSTPWDSTRLFTGYLDELRIYQTALEPTQIMYFASCTPQNSRFSMISVYEGSAPQIILEGGGFASGQSIVLSEGYCETGASSTYTPTPLIVGSDPSTATWEPNPDEMYPPISNDTWASYYLQTYYICYANPADKMFIGGDTNLQLAVVKVDTINGAYSYFNASINAFPMTLVVAGSNLQAGQVLVTSSDPNCNQVDQVLPLLAASYNGSQASVIVSAPSVAGSVSYFCWGASTNAAGSPTTLHPTGISMLAFSPGDQIVRLAAVDGSTQINTQAIKQGMFDSPTNFFNPCSNLDFLGDAFFITLTMGSYIDYYFPLQGHTVCDTLLGRSFFTMWMQEPYTYSAVSPLDPSFTGITTTVPFNWNFGQMGGSPSGFVSDGRDQISSWGDRYNSDHMGGCCFSKPNQDSEWFQAYTIVVASVNKTNRYLAVPLAPTVAVIGETIILQAQVLDTFGNVAQQTVDFLVSFQSTTGGVITQWTVANSSGQLDFSANLSTNMSIYTAFVINVTALNVPNIQNGNSRILTVPIIASTPPAGFTSIDPTKNIPTYLHFGDESTGVHVDYYYIGMYTDWFYEYGGEPNYQPRLNDVATASDDSFFSFSEPTNVTATWTSVSAPNGVFAGTIAASTIQFFALVLYSPVDQSIQAAYSVNTAVRCYLDGVHFITEFSGVNNSLSDTTQLTKGYHQLFCKVYSDEAGTSLFALRFIGAALSWGLNLPLGLPTGTTLLTVNQTLNELLHLGAAGAFITGDFYVDYVSQNTIMPNAGDVSYGLTWTDVLSTTGSWIIDPSNVTGSGSTSVSYFAFGLYSVSDSYVTFEVPSADVGVVYLDGEEVAYYWGGSGASETFELYLSGGWHQVLVKIGMYYGSQPAAFSIVPISIDGIVAYAVQTGSKLPASAFPLNNNQLVTSVMQLFSSNFGIDSTSYDKIPYDPSGPSFFANFSDIDVSAHVTSNDNVTVDILGSGKVESFGWFSIDSTTGVFGSAGMGGSFSSYFALGLYSTVDMSAATFSVVFQQGYAFWLDGELISSSDTFIPGGRTKSFALTQGWHQVIVKLKAASDFQLTPMPNTTTWALASLLCHKANYMQVCSQAAYCPYGVPRPGYFPEAVKGDDYVPARDQTGTWVQVAQNGSTPVCTTMYSPSWSSDKTPYAGRFEVGCCGALEVPRISFSFAADTTTSGELGWNYEIPQQFISQPVITVENPKSSTPTITITCANTKAKIYYTEDYSSPTTSSTLYDGPFDVSTSELITAVCYLDAKSQSTYSYMYTYVPSEPYLTRSSCVASAKCFSDVYGVLQGALISFVPFSAPNKSLYLSLSYATSAPTSLTFQGVFRVSNNNSIIIPAFTQGQYTPIVYDEVGDGTFFAADILFQSLSISPSAAVAVNGVVFTLGGGGVSYGDSVIFLDPLYGSSTLDSTQCSNEACGRAFTNNPNSIQYYTGNAVKVDLLGYTGRLSCLCFAATGEADTAQAPADILNRIAAPVAIDVTVVPPTHTSDTFGLLFPSVVMDAEKLTFAYGSFTDLVAGSYNVVFSPVAGTSSALNGTIRPSCDVISVNTTTVVCSVFARAGVSGKWNVSLEQDGQVLGTLPGTVTVITVVPPRPAIDVASGSCITRSSACVSGAVVTFIGNSFDPVNVDNNNIFFEPTTISCTTVSVTVSALTCRLFVPPDAVGVFSVWVSLTVSSDFKYSYSTGQSLTLGSGDTPGWSGNAATNAPGQTGAGPSGSSNIAGVVAGVFGGALAVIVIVVLVVNRRYALVPKTKQSEEMDAIEQQLNDERPRAGGLEVQVPPIPNVEQHGSVNNV